MSTAEGLQTLADVLSLLEDSDAHVDEPTNVSVDGDTVSARLHVEVPLDAAVRSEPAAEPDADAETDDETVADQLDDETVAAIQEFGAQIEAASRPETEGSTADDAVVTDAEPDDSEDELPEFEEAVGPDEDEDEEGEETTTDGSIEDQDETDGPEFEYGTLDAVVDALANAPGDEDGAITSKPDVEAAVARKLAKGQRELTASEVSDYHRCETGVNWTGRTLNELRKSDELPCDAHREHEDEANTSTVYVFEADEPAESDDGFPVTHEQDEGDDQDDSEDPDGSDDPDDKGPRYWCGACGQGPFKSAGDVKEHHERADSNHAGEPVVWDCDPAEGDLLQGDDDGDDTESTDEADIDVDEPAGSDTAASRTCQNCGAHVTADYARVHAPEDQEDVGPRVCPHCDDKVRERDGTVRESRSSGGSAP